MADSLQQRIERVSRKAHVLVEKYATLLDAKHEADARIESLQAEVDDQRKRIEQLQAEVEYLKISTTIVHNRDDVEKSRALLSGLVREIDQCIADLTD